MSSCVRQLTEAGEVLQALIGDREDPAPLEVWEAFQRFLNVPLTAAEPLRIPSEPGSGGDMMLFEWSVATASPPDCGLVLSVHLVRQVVLEDERGDYDHTEQTVCDFSVCVPAALRHSLEGQRYGMSWGDADESEAWIQEVEASLVYPILCSGVARNLEISHTASKRLSQNQGVARDGRGPSWATIVSRADTGGIGQGNDWRTSEVSTSESGQPSFRDSL